MRQKQAFLSRSFAQRETMQPVAALIAQIACDARIAVLDFVSLRTYQRHEAALMMHAALSAIHRADYLIAEVSHKATGIGVEVGYAVALGKPVLCLRQHTSDYTSTISGVAMRTLIYHDLNDLAQKLPPALAELRANGHPLPDHYQLRPV